MIWLSIMHRFFITNYEKILKVVIFVSIIFFLIAITQLITENLGGFQPLQFGFGFLLYGAFNWADVMVFSFLWVILGIILLRIKQKEFFWVAYFSFWLIRSSGEALYSFLQQFHPQTKPWLVHAPKEIMQNSFLGKFLLDQFWIVEQIFFQSIAILSLFGLTFTISKIFIKKDKQ